ncbi:malate:quinone oxidoreductase [Taibaiella lutea]|uniref:Probable malate:quinone oxidoreductase n=1 Tax=Taibaiella lutea TaxID=2608001 RepID=A0A5M6CK07_9BACT|nr:malate:quinone oxidoreductase [Taibaiella lutea]KAA5533449.1 malate:quinone oxidoreductase [Taibaiella lutea]
MTKKSEDQVVDVVLIGAGIMSATLGVFLKQLQPDWNIEILERLDEVAAESSAAWNNAGTGHAALCELNYTPQKEDGSVDCSKAFKINEQFEVSKQFWAYLVEHDLIKPDFIKPVPHMSFVRGAEDIAYLKKRHEALTQHELFKGMQYSEDHAVLKQWFPLMMEDRDPTEEVAATKMDLGTDVNFGALAWSMIQYLFSRDRSILKLAQDVKDIDRSKDDKYWEVKVKNLTTDVTRIIKAKFVFIGAGGGALHLLEKSDIPEAKGYGGFPVSGQWLRCTNPEVIERHHAKVYGKAAVGAPPMSVPHLDSRMINGEKELLFGPYAGFSTKFLKNGSYMDLPTSIKFGNIVPMLQAGIHNLSLTKYLIQQVRLSPEEKLEVLKEFYPDAKMEDWELAIAGQRVQVIKKNAEGDGVLEFGTELVSAADGSIAALLGASPGASTAVSVMLELLKKCFPEQMSSASWQSKIREMIPSFGRELGNNPDLLHEMRKWYSGVLKLDTAETV